MTLSSSTLRFPRIMLFHSTYDIFSHTDIRLAIVILKNVDAIRCRHSRENWLRGLDLNQRPSGYEPDELPGCSTPRVYYVDRDDEIKLKVHDGRHFICVKVLRTTLFFGTSKLCGTRPSHNC